MRRRLLCICWLFMMLLLNTTAFAQTAKNKSIITTKTVIQKLPQKIFLQLIDSIERFELNDATAFKHVELPPKYHQSFLGFIKDSVGAEIPGLKSLVYYGITLRNGAIINGDIYWNDTKSYIVFKIDGKKYVNVYKREGVAQVKTIFKL